MFTLLFDVYQCLACFVNITCTDGEDQITGGSQAAKRIGDIGECGTVDGICNFFSQMGGRDTKSILLTGGINLSQYRNVGQFENLDKFLKQLVGTGLGVGLERTDHPTIPQILNCGQQSL